MPEEGTKFHIEIKECPLKYEFLRRPSLVFPEEKCYFHTDSTLKTSHESYIQVHIEQSLRNIILVLYYKYSKYVFSIIGLLQISKQCTLQKSKWT